MVKKRASKKQITQQKRMRPNSRAGLIFAGLISLMLGWVLWEHVLNIEQVIAILLFIAGVSKILWGIFGK